VLAALVSSTLLNCVFPFFTYLPSSGLLGERLPQVRCLVGWRGGGWGWGCL